MHVVQPVADEVEAEPVEIRLQSRLHEIIGDDFRTGCEAGFHPRLAREAALDGLLRQKSRRQHDGGIGRIGARRDRGNDDRAVGHFRFRGRGDGGAATFARKTRIRVVAGFGAVATVACCLPGRERFSEFGFHVAKRDPILRTTRPGEIRNDGSEIEFQRIGE